MIMCTQLDSHLLPSGLLYHFVPDKIRSVYLVTVGDRQKNYIKDITISPLIIVYQQFLLFCRGRYFPCVFLSLP